MDAQISRSALQSVSSDPVTQKSQVVGPNGDTTVSPVDSDSTGAHPSHSVGGGMNGDCVNNSDRGDYTQFAESIADKLGRVPLKYHNFLLRLCETLDRSSAELAAIIFPALSAAHQERALIALLDAECAGDVFVHDRIEPLPRHQRLTRDTRSAKWLIAFDDRMFDLADVQVYVFGSDNPADLLGEDISVLAWGRRWLVREQASESTRSPLNSEA